MRRVWMGLAALMLGFITVSPGAFALDVGDRARAVTFETLDGFRRTMDNYDDNRQGTVIMYISSRCPVTAELIDRITALHTDNRFSIHFIAVATNIEESGDELRTFRHQTGGIYPIYRDVDGEARAVFAPTATPEFFLLDDAGVLRYRGGLGSDDDAPGLVRAMKQLIDGVPVDPASAPVAGTPIDAPAPPREIPVRYGTPSYQSQLIFETIAGVAVHHCSIPAEAPNGDILTLWYGGSYESSEDQALYMARLEKGACRWNEPERVVWNPGQPPGNAALFTDPDGRMGIAWGRMEGNWPLRRGSGWGDCRLIARWSDDNGHTWSEDREIDGSYGWLPRTTPLTLADGTFALPISGRVEGLGSGSFLLTLGGDGETWSRRGFIPGASQPAVTVRDNGDLFCLMRSSPRSMMSVSTDHGHTWSESVQSDRRNPGSGIAMIKLDSGRTVLVYTDAESAPRTPMVIAGSTDDGQTWDVVKTLATDLGEVSYPNLIQAADGTIHITFTYRRYSIMHIAINEDWLTEGTDFEATTRPN